ncbi:hypothetical protein AQI95_23470 [Streptomyces yokosukanensis]|uniref:Uncharacterized protein n=1 Tax=Streptomyces yokosukanensis TaxID=67386 RepID=A0A101P224_9ACTN|nr:hypothetical protein AQI95_23470 [Streptomyces yokosukanensis]
MIRTALALLCSSTAGAALAAGLGLPIAVAHHIRPDSTFTVLERYRAAFVPSRWCEQPRVVPTPADAATHPFTAEERHALAGFRAQQACGTPETVVRRLDPLAGS